MTALKFPVKYEHFLTQFLDGVEQENYSTFAPDWLVSFENEKGNLIGNGLMFNSCGLVIAPIEVITSYYLDKSARAFIPGVEKIKPENTQRLGCCDDEGLHLIKIDTQNPPENFGIKIYSGNLSELERIAIFMAENNGKLNKVFSPFEQSDMDKSQFNTNEYHFPHGS
jgi:hypothetical protein